MTTTYSPNKNLALMGTGDSPGAWGGILNSAVFTILDNNLGGQNSTTLTSADVTLTLTQAGSLIQTLTGTLTTNVNLIFPASSGGFFFIENGTTGAFTVTCKSSGGTGVAVPQGYQSLIYINGTTNVAYEIASNSPTSIGSITANSLLGNNTGSSASPIALTVSQVNTLLGCAVLSAVENFTAAQRITRTALGSVSGTVTPDFNTSNNFSMTLIGSATLANPNNQTADQGGQIIITQDGTGGRSMTFGSNWKFSGGISPTLSTSPNAVDILSYFVESSTRISASLLPNTM